MPMVIGTLRHTSPLNIPVRRPGELWRRHVATRRRSVRLSELPRTYADASGSGQRDEAPLQRIDRYGLGLDLSAKASSDPKRRRKSSATAQETGQAADEEEVMGEELRQFFEATVDDSPSVDASEPGAKSGRRSRASGGSVRKSALEVSLRRWMQEYPDAIILVQVGSFYETYFEQAPLVARALGIKLTSKTFSQQRHPFAGFPLAQLSKQVSTLVETGHKVVIIDESRQLDFNGKDVEITRSVTRVVSPGTGIDELFVKTEQFNFILSVVPASEDDDDIALGLAYRDISTGASFSRESSLANLAGDLSLIQPSEVVLDESLRGTDVYERLLAATRRARGNFMLSTAAMTSNSSADITAELKAHELLASYLATMLLNSPPPASAPTHIDVSTVMLMEASTQQALEIRSNLRGGTKGSLLSTIKRTTTMGGFRLLSERLCAPSTELSLVRDRLAQVSFFARQPFARQDLQDMLGQLEDTTRTLQRIFLRRGNAFDLLSLKRAILTDHKVHARMLDALADDERQDDSSWSEETLSERRDDRHTVRKSLLSRLSLHETLAHAIEEAVDEEALTRRTMEAEKRAALVEEFGTTHADRAMDEEEESATWTEGLWGKNEEWAVRPIFDKKLAELHKTLANHRRVADKLERRLRVKYSSDGLELKVVPKLGAVMRVPRKGGYQSVEADEDANLLQRTGSSRTYQLSLWTSLHATITSATARIREMENRVFAELTSKLLESYESIFANTRIIDELDVALGFAELAHEMQLTRPTMTEGTVFDVKGARHPTVEHSLRVINRPFRANDLTLSHPDNFVHVITGPNMAGKSTLLRQTALISVLAQAGSFVPASHATLGLVDKVFTRIGAHDELDRDRSTFMVEMDEVANILTNATERSLVLLDEVGRGTSPLDGLAISYGTLEHLVHENRSRTLFATHFHELARLVEYDGASERCAWQGVEFWCTDVQDDEGGIAYSHQLRRGMNDDSHGLSVARLAGMPSRAHDLAHETKLRLQQQEARPASAKA